MLLRVERWAAQCGAKAWMGAAAAAFAWSLVATASAAPAADSSPAVDATAATDSPARAKARALAYAGVEAFAVADYRTANEKLEESYRLLPVPSLGLWSARTLVKLGKLVDAERRYRDVAAMAVGPSDPPVQTRAKVDAARELDELLPRIASLQFELEGAPAAQIEVDGVVLPGTELGRPQRVDPGRHVVVGTLGAERKVVIVNLAEGEHADVPLKFAIADAPKGAPPVHAVDVGAAPVQRTARALRTAGWITLAAGGASAAAGVVAYFVGRSDGAEVDRRNACTTPECSTVTEAYSTYETWRTLHLVGLLSGGLLGAAGVTLIVAGHTSDSGERGHLGLSIGPGSASFVGTF